MIAGRFDAYPDTWQGWVWFILCCIGMAVAMIAPYFVIFYFGFGSMTPKPTKPKRSEVNSEDRTDRPL